MSWLISNWPAILMWILTIVGGAAVFVKGIAPLTKSKWDDKLGGFLSKVHGAMSKLALNPAAPPSDDEAK